MAANDPEAAKAGMAAWMAWARQAGEAIVDLGTPLQAVGTPGPGDHIGGYSILQTADDDALQAVLQGHPHTAWGGAQVRGGLPSRAGPSRRPGPHPTPRTWKSTLLMSPRSHGDRRSPVRDDLASRE